jgi:serine/threonine protein kinase
MSQVSRKYSLLLEMAVMRLDHPNLVRLQGSHLWREHLFLVMDLMDGGSLGDVMEECKDIIDEMWIVKIIREVLKGVAYLHSMSIVHADLKPANVLLSSDGAVKLADFGLSEAVAPGQFLQGRAGSERYMAPEVARGLGFGSKADIWSVGGIAMDMLREEEAGIVRVSPELLDFLWRAVEADQDRRWAADCLLEHPFLGPDRSEPLLEAVRPEELPDRLLAVCFLCSAETEARRATVCLCRRLRYCRPSCLEADSARHGDYCAGAARRRAEEAAGRRRERWERGRSRRGEREAN